MKVKISIKDSTSHYEFETVADDATAVIKKIKAKRKEIFPVFNWLMMKAKISVCNILSGDEIMTGTMSYNVFSGRGDIEVKERVLATHF